MIYAKTPAGQAAFAARDAALSSKLRIAYLMVDGARDHLEILTATSGMGVTPADMQHLLELGFITEVVVKTNTERRQALSGAQQSVIFLEASRRATALTASMGLRGYRLNLAVETATSLADLEALIPQLEEDLGVVAVRPLAALLKHD